MKFLQIARAPEGLTSYAKVRRARPVQTAITVIEALLSLMGVVVLILTVRYGSFAKAGSVLDQAVGCVAGFVKSVISHLHP